MTAVFILCSIHTIMYSISFRAWLENHSFDVSLADDTFIHFTPQSRAEQIIKSGILSMNPPFPKFGTDAVDAISVNYGRFVPGTQITHIKLNPSDNLVAILFKTNIPPYAGYPEEIKWDRDVTLLQAKIISQGAARQMLLNNRKKFKGIDDYEIRYR